MENNRNKNKRKNILMIGPYPPAVGGVSNFIYNMKHSKIFKKNLNLEVFITDVKNENNTIFFHILIEIKKIISFVSKRYFKNYDIVHFHTASYFSFYRTFLYFLMVKILSKSKIFMHIHGGKFIEFYYNSNYFNKKIIKYTFKNSQLLIVTSLSWVRKISKLVKNNKKIEILHNGFDEKLFRPMDKNYCRDKLNLPENKKLILSIGNLIKEKGHIFLIRSLNGIIKNDSDLDMLCIIIGNGPLKQLLNNEIRSYNLEKYIKIIGAKSHKDIPYWINASDLVILPSLFEGNPTVMFESLGCGKPFIGTKVGGIPDIITSDDYGLLCEPSNSKDMGEKILIALTKNWDYKQILKYAERFTWNNISKKLMEIYSNTW